MSLLSEVVSVLEARRIPHALIGAAALAIHGISRATADVDLLTVDERALHGELWSGLEARGVQVRLLRGDADDPLFGTARLSLQGERLVDVVVGREAWQAEIIEAAPTLSVGEVSMKVVQPAGFVLLKLFACGPRDAWDVRALLESHENADSITAEVEAMIARLPAESRRLWEQIRDAR